MVEVYVRAFGAVPAFMQLTERTSMHYKGPVIDNCSQRKHGKGAFAAPVNLLHHHAAHSTLQMEDVSHMAMREHSDVASLKPVIP